MSEGHMIDRVRKRGFIFGEKEAPNFTALDLSVEIKNTGTEKIICLNQRGPGDPHAQRVEIAPGKRGTIHHLEYKMVTDSGKTEGFPYEYRLGSAKSIHSGRR